MIPGQAKSLVALIALVASLFFMAQLVGWSWARIIVGATRRFAQGIIGFVVSGALAYQVLRLEEATGPRFASGPPLSFVAVWWITVFGYVPVLTIVEFILSVRAGGHEATRTGASWLAYRCTGDLRDVADSGDAS